MGFFFLTVPKHIIQVLSVTTSFVVIFDNFHSILVSQHESCQKPHKEQIISERWGKKRKAGKCKIPNVHVHVVFHQITQMSGTFHFPINSNVHVYRSWSSLSTH